jgi:large subunit ribosomal protein L6
MSRIGQKPVDIASGVTVKVDGAKVFIKGPKGELTLDVPSSLKASVDNGKVNVSRSDETRMTRGCHGLVRTLIQNMIEGVTKGFSKDLEIQGVGFKAALQGRKLVLSLGFSSPVEYPLPEGINVTVDAGTKLVVSGPDKQMVGDVSARIRSFYPAEPYKGKGVRYKGEYVRRKVGKSVA